LPTSSQGAAAEQLNISRGCLRNIWCKKVALRSEALLLEGRRKRQRHGKDQKVEKGLATFSDNTVCHAHLCAWEWRKFVPRTRLIGPLAINKPKIARRRGGL